MLHASGFMLVFALFSIALLVRLFVLLPSDTVLGYDQIRDLFDAMKIASGHIRIVGPVAGNNLYLHHGVLYLYYIAPALWLSHGNPMAVVIFNSIFSSLKVVVIYLLAKSLFKDRRISLIAGLMTAISPLFVQYAGWLSNPTGTVWSVLLFFGSVWAYKQNKKWGLPVAALALGMCIQFELFFIYLIPTFFILWIFLKLPKPTFRLAFISFSILTLTLSTMIATEVKFGFAGIRSIFIAGSGVGGGVSMTARIESYLSNWDAMYLNLLPSYPHLGLLLGVVIAFIYIYRALASKNKFTREVSIFLLIWFFSPSIMLLLGSHNAPWFLVGRPGAAVLMIAGVLGEAPLLVSLTLSSIILLNMGLATFRIRAEGLTLLSPDPSSRLTTQLLALDYTYSASEGQPFGIMSVTNPLYINTPWAYHYVWYGERLGKLPSWYGGDQVAPYDTLPKPRVSDVYLYILMDTTFRIPDQFRTEARVWADKRSTLVETKDFGGILVEKRRLKASE